MNKYINFYSLLLYNMISSCLMGGLGNQLFQIFTCISLSISNQTSFEFNITEKPIGGTIRNSYWITFFRALYKSFITEQHKYQFLREQHFTYDPIYIPNDQTSYKLFGYFQSYKYFDSNKDTIFNLIQLDMLKCGVLKKMDVSSNNYISMHFRIGDYKFIQESHPVLSVQYYENALELLHQLVPEFVSIPVIYFYEKKDEKDVLEKITHLKRKFKNKFIPISEKLADWEQLLVMSQCKYNIIANSTFSWWGAYLNTIENQVVCYPETWFGGEIQHDARDLFMDSWIKITT